MLDATVLFNEVVHQGSSVLRKKSFPTLPHLGHGLCTKGAMMGVVCPGGGNKGVQCLVTWGLKKEGYLEVWWWVWNWVTSA